MADRERQQCHRPTLLGHQFAEHVVVGQTVRQRLETRCAALGLPLVSALDPIVTALSDMLGQRATSRPGRQHVMDAAYFRRVDAINYLLGGHDINGHLLSIGMIKKFGNYQLAEALLSSTGSNGVPKAPRCDRNLRASTLRFGTYFLQSGPNLRANFGAGGVVLE